MYEDTDRDMSSWVLTTLSEELGIRLYVADTGSITSRVKRAKRFRYYGEAEKAVTDCGPIWYPISVPEAMGYETGSSK